MAEKKAEINIRIRGLALAYNFPDADVNRWRVLFPFDACHSIKLSCGEAGKDLTFLGHFGTPGMRLHVKHSGAPKAGTATEDFESVFDMTSGTTHDDGLEMKTGWNDLGLLLTLDNAKLSVWHFLDEFFRPNRLVVSLTRGEEEQPVNGRIAYSFRAAIDLAEDAVIDVLAHDRSVFRTQPGVSYDLLIDNECIQMPEPVADGKFAQMEKGDMQMYYKLLADPKDEKKQFEVTGQATPGAESPALPFNEVLEKFLAMDSTPSLSLMTTDFFRTGEGKPCMTGRISNPANLAS